MKKYLVLLIAAVMMIGGTSTMKAQNAPEKKARPHLTEEQIIERRTNQMVQVLMLDDATAAKFVPVYSEYLKEKMDCRKLGFNQKNRKDNVGKIKTDAEIDQMIQNQFAQSHKMLDIREKYYAKFHKILSPKQILKIYQTEKQDQNKMHKEMMRRGMKKQGMPRVQQDK